MALYNVINSTITVSSQTRTYTGDSVKVKRVKGLPRLPLKMSNRKKKENEKLKIPTYESL